MKKAGSVFQETYRHYLNQIRGVDLKGIHERLGATLDGEAIRIPVFGTPYRVSPASISDPQGERASFEICIILSKYVLMCPEAAPPGDDWVTYRGLKDSGPLTVYFSTDVERPIVSAFQGRLPALQAAGERLDGRRPDMELPHDLSIQFQALPRISMLLLFNDADEEFTARCSILYQRKAEAYLDAECLAVAGRLLYTSLVKGKA